MKNRILFDKSATKDILDALGYSIDSEGYVFSASLNRRITTDDGEIIKADMIDAIKNGKIYNNDLVSLLSIEE